MDASDVKPLSKICGSVNLLNMTSRLRYLMLSWLVGPFGFFLTALSLLIATQAVALDDASVEALRLRVEQQKAYQSLNNVNPMSTEYDPNSGVTAGTGPAGDFQRLLAQPAVQSYLKIFSNPVFSKGVDQVLKSPRRMELLYAELGFIVFMIIFRAWRFSKCTHWTGKLWTSIWTFGFFWVGSGVLVPWLVLGEAYTQLMSGTAILVIEALKK